LRLRVFAACPAPKVNHALEDQPQLDYRGGKRSRRAHGTVLGVANKVIATSPIGQAAQAVIYVPDAIPVMGEGKNTAMTTIPAAAERAGTENLRCSCGWRHRDRGPDKAPTSVSLFDQGLVQVLEASVAGLDPGKPYVLALSAEASGGALQPLQGFMINPAGAAVVNAIGPIRQLVRGEDKAPRRYLVIVPGEVGDFGAPVQVQTE
jgi:hypothetical protein